MKKKLAMIILTAFLAVLLCASVQAATVDIPSMPDMALGGGSLSFDLILTGLTTVTTPDAFLLELQVTAPGEFPVGSLVGPADSRYIFPASAVWPVGNGNPGGLNTVSFSDGTFTPNNSPLNSLLATVTLDYPALPLNTVLNIGFFGSASSISFNPMGGGGNSELINVLTGDLSTQVVPIPGSILLLGSGLIGLVGLARRRRS